MVTTGSEELPDEEFCPFFLNASYHCATAYLEMSTQEKNEECLLRFRHIKGLFAACSQRWKIGGKSRIVVLDNFEKQS